MQNKKVLLRHLAEFHPVIAHAHLSFSDLFKAHETIHLLGDSCPRYNQRKHEHGKNT